MTLPNESPVRTTDRFDDVLLVVGHQRSGTSLVAQAVARATGIELVDDPEWTFNRYVRPVLQGSETLSDMLDERLDGLRGKILKAPSLTPLTPVIAEAHPKFRLLSVVRDPRDVAAAAVEWRRARDQSAIDDFWDMSWLGIEDGDHLWMLARRWLVYVEAASKVQGVVWARYEDFSSDPDGAANDVLRRLALTKTASAKNVAGVQFKKDFNRGVIRGYGRWQEDLDVEQSEMIQEQCSEWIKRFGYFRE